MIDVLIGREADVREAAEGGRDQSESFLQT